MVCTYGHDLLILREPAVEGEQLLYTRVGSNLGVDCHGLHELEVGAHFVGEPGLAAQLRDEVHQLGHAGADFARLGARYEQRLARVVNADVVFLEYCVRLSNCVVIAFMPCIFVQ